VQARFHQIRKRGTLLLVPEVPQLA
jgi:hypothetical protein